ncbi:MAG: thioredoxin family protein [Candidatus Aramenus sp.]|nr:thioredoxin family protein [Candidatus Aramenus sp.]
MSYDPVIRQYLNAINGITIEFCNAEDFVVSLKKEGVTLEAINCEKPTIRVRRGNRVYFTYRGIPQMNELWPFLNALVRVSNNVVHLDEKEMEMAKVIRGNVKLFVTPDCTKCPLAAELLYQLPIVNDNVDLEVIDVNDYPDLAKKFRVMSVPKIVLNEKAEIPGSFPPHILLKMMAKSSS